MEGLGDTPVGRQVSSILARAATGDVDDLLVVERFHPSFLDSVPAAAVVSILNGATWTASASVVQVKGSDTQLVALVDTDDGRMRISAHVEDVVPHRFVGLLLRPAAPSPTEILDGTPRDHRPVAEVVADHLGGPVEGLPAGGCVVGVVRDGKRDVIALGDVPPDASFEIGSIAKTITGMLLAEMVLRGELRTDDPVQGVLPDGVMLPSDRITFEDLATHASGFPRLPPGIEDGMDPDDPYAHIDIERFHQELAQTTLDGGGRVAYSNFGFALLGYALSIVGGRAYADLASERGCEPLHLHRTMVTDHDTRLVDGYAGRDEVRRWSGDLFAPAGRGWVSSADDMLAYAEAVMSVSGAASPSDAVGLALNGALEPRRPMEDRMRIGCGWIRIACRDGSDVFFHNGGTSGFRSFLAAYPPSGVGVVLLSNQAEWEPDPHGFGLLAALAATGGADSV